MALAAKASQEFVKIKEIRDGVVVMRDGSLRAILMCSSINFALKSEDNQTAILAQFADFLNTLDFSLQLVAESRRFDVKPYLAELEKRAAAQTNELLKLQTREYIGFIGKFTENTNIMNKTFFAVVPYAPSLLEMKGGGSGVAGAVRKKLGLGEKGGGGAAEGGGSFAAHKEQLLQRVAVVEQGLIRTGIRIALLGTEELVELFYHLFNPGETERAVATA